MSYLVLARKYRPQTFGEMTGQEHVVRTLSNAFRTGHLAHAYLFTGPRGVGKTTAARLVARCLDCAKGPTAEPCGACAACVEIAEGRSVDVVEIDAASNNGVDNIRDIVDAVKYRPARDRFKVFVVDEVHMLSAGAFNALLKTLEEPPEHVKFVLATTDVHKVPETIVSRCQRFDFRRLTQQQIVGQLRKVADAEALRVSDAALGVVARAAEGGMRDALSMLDQVRAACGEEASDVAVAEAIGAIDPGAIARIGRALVARDGAAVLREVGDLHARGHEMKRVAEELVRHLRDVVVAKLVPDAPIDQPDAGVAEVRAQADAASAPQLTRLFDLAQQGVADIKLSEQPRYALEVALLKACFLAPGAEVSELIARLEEIGGGPAASAAAGRAGSAQGAGARLAPSGAVPRSAPTAPRATGTLAASAGHPGSRAAASKPSGSRESPPSPPAPAVPAAGSAQDSPPAPSEAGATRPPSGAAVEWRALVAEVERSSAALGTALRHATLVGFREGEVAIRMPPGTSLSTLERRRGEIEEVLGRALGRPTSLAIARGTPDATPAADRAAPAASIAQAEEAERQARVGRARAHPRIQEATQILDGEVTKIDEL